MALFFTRIKTHLNLSSILNWSKLISITASAQLIVQAVGFLSGILIIRLLPVQEYAYYTLANTMLGTMTILADGGISSVAFPERSYIIVQKKCILCLIYCLKF